MVTSATNSISSHSNFKTGLTLDQAKETLQNEPAGAYVLIVAGRNNACILLVKGILNKIYEHPIRMDNQGRFRNGNPDAPFDLDALINYLRDKHLKSL